MKDNIIEFLYPKDCKDLFDDVLPEPAQLNIPEWYKELNHNEELLTVKGCIPFLDTLTAGYILKIPQDTHIRFNVINEENGKPDLFVKYSFARRTDDLVRVKLNLNNSHPESHPIEQLGPKCPFHNKNKNLPFIKILNPFIIKTPPGYSCLFVSPLNNSDDRFNIISGIVDTDTFNGEINFPIIVNGDKYPSLDSVIERGTPYVQIIPFKRENWKMKVKEHNKNIFVTRLAQAKSFLYNYKKHFWFKKKWK